MLKIALLIAAGAAAVRAFGSMPRQLELVRTEDTGVCAGGSNWLVDWPADEPTTRAKYTQCWEECEMASAQSFEEHIYGVPSRELPLYFTFPRAHVSGDEHDSGEGLHEASTAAGAGATFLEPSRNVRDDARSVIAPPRPSAAPRAGKAR